MVSDKLAKEGLVSVFGWNVLSDPPGFVLPLLDQDKLVVTFDRLIMNSWLSSEPYFILFFNLFIEK